MKKFVFLFAIVLTFCFTASAQFSFTSKAGKNFGVSSAPHRNENRGAYMMEFYYMVEGSNIVVYEVTKTNGKVRNSIDVTIVPIDEINITKFKVQKLENTCYLNTGTPFTKITYSSDNSANDKYNSDDLTMYFKTCDDAEELRKKVLGDAADDLDLSDLDLDLEDKPKEKPKSTMPAHLFALIGSGSKIYQLNRRTNEIWDMSTNNVFKMGKIDESGDSLRMLIADESYFTYNVRDGKLYNSDKYLGYKLTDGVLCKSGNGEMCVDRWEIDRSKDVINRVFKSDFKPTEIFEKYKIRGEATDEEILLIFAFVEKLK